jgi:hypothetical protein
MELPIYQLIIDPTEGAIVDFVALVDKPAIQKNYQAFNEQKKYEFKASKDKQVISGPLMIPDVPIYRRDEMGEYYVTFTKETVNQIMTHFMKNNFGANVNAMHDPEQVIDGVYMIETFQIDKERGVKTPEIYGEELPDGTWWGSYKVDNQKVWQEYIKTGIWKGFSIEGVFKHKYLVKKEQSEIDQMNEKLLNIKKRLNEIKKAVKDLHN